MTIAGEVEEFYPGAFTLDETTWGAELLIVPAEGTSVPSLITPRAARPDVEIAGTVRLSEAPTRCAGRALRPLTANPTLTPHGSR